MRTVTGVFVLCLLALTQVVYAQKSRGEEADTSARDEPTIVEVEYDLPPAPPAIPETKEEEPVFMVVEDMPQFPRGEEAMMKYLAKNIHYPKEAKNKNIQGRVIVQFVIDEKGNVTNAKVVKGIGYGCDEEALRVIKAMPKWKPGKQRGKAVKVRYVLPIRFVLN